MLVEVQESEIRREPLGRGAVGRGNLFQVVERQLDITPKSERPREIPTRVLFDPRGKRRFGLFDDLGQQIFGLRTTLLLLVDIGLE